MWTAQSSLRFQKAISNIPHTRILQKHIDQALLKQPKLLKKFNEYSSCKKDELKPYITAAKENRVCPVCTDHFVHWSRDSNSWTPACRICMRTSVGKEAIKAKIKQTFTTNYGVDNPSKVSSIKKQKKKTNLRRYGVENPAQNKQVRKRMANTMLERHGATHAFKVPKLKKKMEATMIERHGVANAIHSEVIEKRKRAAHKEKYGVEHQYQRQEVKDKHRATTFKRFGVHSTFQSEKVKAKSRLTWKRNHGVDNPLKSKAIQKKVFTSQHRIHTVVTKRATYQVQGYERYIIYTLEKKFNTIYDQYHPLSPSFDLENGTNYSPDFYVAKYDLNIEIKCLWTLFKSSKSTWKLNRYKAEQCYELGLNMKWAVVEMINKRPWYFILPKTWFKMTYDELKDYCENKEYIKGVYPKNRDCVVANKGV